MALVYVVPAGLGGVPQVQAAECQPTTPLKPLYGTKYYEKYVKANPQECWKQGDGLCWHDPCQVGKIDPEALDEIKKVLGQLLQKAMQGGGGGGGGSEGDYGSYDPQDYQNYLDELNSYYDDLYNSSSSPFYYNPDDYDYNPYDYGTTTYDYDYDYDYDYGDGDGDGDANGDGTYTQNGQPPQSYYTDSGNSSGSGSGNSGGQTGNQSLSTSNSSDTSTLATIANQINQIIGQTNATVGSTGGSGGGTAGGGNGTPDNVLYLNDTDFDRIVFDDNEIIDPRFPDNTRRGYLDGVPGYVFSDGNQHVFIAAPGGNDPNFNWEDIEQAPGFFDSLFGTLWRPFAYLGELISGLFGN